jgi:DNA-binding XRE family transcriptional regulator
MTEFTDPKVVGQRLKKRREELQLTQKDVADKLHVSVPCISNWESGMHVPFDWDKVQICKLYGRRVEKIFYN